VDSLLGFLAGGAVLGLVGPAVAAASVHPLVYYSGGDRYELTYKVFAFYAPFGVLGSVAGLNAVALPALFFLEVRGVKEVHDLDWWEAFAALLAPGLVLSAIGLVLGLAAVEMSLIPVRAFFPGLETVF